MVFFFFLSFEFCNLEFIGNKGRRLGFSALSGRILMSYFFFSGHPPCCSRSRIIGSEYMYLGFFYRSNTSIRNSIQKSRVKYRLDVPGSVQWCLKKKKG